MHSLYSFFTVAAQDERLSTAHICVYAALWSIAVRTPVHPFSISRRELMSACKIYGNATYHKCVRELHQYGYITYVPSYHPILGSLVTLNNFSMLLNV